MRTRDIALILISACLLIFSFPKINQPLFAWFAFVPLLYAVEEKSAYRSFLLGWLCGLIFSIGLVYWIVVVTTTYGRLSYPIGIALMLMLSAYLALYSGLSLGLSRYVEQKSSIALPLVFPFFWVSLEYIRSFLLSGFPWENLGYSQYRLRTLMQSVDVTGVYGISFLIVWVNALIYLLLRGIAQRNIPWKSLTLTIFMLVSDLLYGTIRISEVEKLAVQSPALRVGLVQGNIDQGIKWDRNFREQALNTHQALSLRSLQDKAELVIWPESATPFYFQSEPYYQEALFDLIQDRGAYLLVGSPAFSQEHNRVLNFNSAFLLSPSRTIAGRYDKMHLVPYGEYVPLKELFFFVDKMVEGIGDFSPGRKISLLQLPGAQFGVLICYEIIFPDLTRRFVKQGADFLVNITNDAWFGNTSAPYQLFSMAVVRAIENKRFIARSANTGVSGIITPTGEIESASVIFTEAAITARIKLLTMSTFYSAYGDVFALFVTAAALFLVAAAAVKKGVRKGRC